MNKTELNQKVNESIKNHFKLEDKNLIKIFGLIASFISILFILTLIPIIILCIFIFLFMSFTLGVIAIPFVLLQKILNKFEK